MTTAMHAPVKIVVWDAVGNVMWGVPDWQRRDPAMRARMTAEMGGDEARARAGAPSWEQLFADHPAQLIHVDSLGALETVIADVDYLVLHKVAVPAEVLRLGRKLRLVQHLGLDDRGMPHDVLREMGIPGCATPLINYFAVAEHAWAQILTHLKKMAQQRVSMQTGGYLGHWGTHPGLQLACDQTLGLLGFGEIARPVARIARAFDMRVVYWDIQRFEPLEALYGVAYVAWEQLFATADVVSVHLALNDRTHGIIGAREINAMKPGALFVNTARGKLVDQTALVQAVRERRIAAALDVFAEEPLPLDDPLHALHADLENNLTLTAHTAWQSHWTHVRDSLGIWNNVLRDLRGEPVEHRVA
jgi:phosphoglycerate dehydrogenase-like enzyme